MDEDKNEFIFGVKINMGLRWVFVVLSIFLGISLFEGVKIGSAMILEASDATSIQVETFTNIQTAATVAKETVPDHK